ncbi:cation:proton antiporter [Palleniella muris]|uniref:Cation:proton antiporter n=1 Tax=Palleniella muris TaxID=3038145 RepID=A0AC61QLR7_9BACT|nr:cation:proton antiporter [Palleniella muris]TGX79926.1 cation:proton antiporter [Palleniella muris]
MPYLTQYFPITDPTMIFLTVMLIILLAPIIMGKLRIPHIIGMVLAGVVIGKYGLNVIVRGESFEIFGNIGLYYIMFLAGLEMDTEGLKKNARRVLVFGLLSFITPFVLTYFTSVAYLDYSPMSALLLGCIMSSCTLIAYPIVGRYGIQRRKVVTLSVGASMLSLLLSLIVLAALTSAYQGNAGDPLFWILFLAKFVAYCAAAYYAIRWITVCFLRRYSDAVMQFIFVIAVLSSSAVMASLVGLEGIFGAFYSGLVLNRFIPNVSPLMNRIEFIGNALFIPYFLIGVGMLIDVSVMFEGGNILLVIFIMVVFGTLGKAIAAYASCLAFRMPWSAGNMMFGLTSAHAAGAIAMVMVGMKMEVSTGEFLMDNTSLNGVVMMILFTCVISTIVTEQASKQIVIQDKRHRIVERQEGDDEKILIPVKYPETCDTLLNLAILMRNRKLNRGVIALNVVYDDDRAAYNQKQGQELLAHITKTAAAIDVRVQTQVRLATNIANGIKHAFREFDASEIIMGLHIHQEITTRFWGEFAQSLFNGLNRQIIIARCVQPLSTLHRLQVAVPSRAEFEPGFHRWVERLARMAGNLNCRIVFHGRHDTLQHIKEYINTHHHSVRAQYSAMEHWNHLPTLASQITDEDMFVIITARQGTISYKNAMDRLPDELSSHFKGHNTMIVFPDQYGKSELMTFTSAQHTEQISAYDMLRKLFTRK